MPAAQGAAGPHDCLGCARPAASEGRSARLRSRSAHRWRCPTIHAPETHGLRGSCHGHRLKRPRRRRPPRLRLWHMLTREGVARGAGRRAGARADERGGGQSPCALRAQPLRRGQDGVALARVPAPVPRPDADRPAGRRRDLDLPGQADGHGDRDPAADPVQRSARPAAGGQGRGRRGGAGEDDDRQGPRAPRRGAHAVAGRGARAGGRRRDRGRRRRPRRRPRARRRDARGRRGGAHRREPARGQGRRARSRRPMPRSATAPTWST